MTGSDLTNDSAILIAEFAHRKILAKLGYANFNDLDIIDHEIFVFISGEISKIESENIKKSSRRAGK